MTTLNRCGAGLHAAGATACTDVTGFGLTGHGLEMARGSGVTLAISAGALPQLPRAAELCAAGFTCGGTRSNSGFTAGGVRFDPALDEGMIGLLNDPRPVVDCSSPCRRTGWTGYWPSCARPGPWPPP